MQSELTLFRQDDLLNRLSLNHREGKKTVFLVGSPLTAPWAPGKRGVPGVAAMVERSRQALAEIGKDSDSSDYQGVLRALQGAVGIERVNRLVREAVLDACTLENGDLRQAALVGDERSCKALEHDPGAWALSPGVEALGELAATFPDIFGTEVLTSNFDPLISVSILKAGGRAWQTRLHGDDNLDADSAIGCRVIHAHGYWYGADMLHAPAQLQQPRPGLRESLRRRFQHTTLAVVAYGGWNDIFTATLFELVRDGGAFPEILWTFYSDQEEQVRSRFGPLLEKLEPGIARGRVDLFGGIDSNRFFPAALERLRPVAPPVPASSAAMSATIYRTASPFVVGPPIETDEDLLGRAQERDSIRYAVVRRQPVQILGERRMGKTSLLRWVRRHAGDWPEVRDWPLACVSAQGPARRSPADFVQAIGFSLGRGAEVAGWISECSTTQAEVALRRLLPLMVLVDEADELTKEEGPFEDGFLETLRAYGQDQRLVWVSSSLDDLHRSFQSRGRTSAFLNDSYQVPVGRLDDEAAQNLLARGGWSAEVMKLLFTEGGGLPYPQQCIADAFFRTGRLPEAVDALDMAMSSVFETWWRHRTETEQVILRSAVDGLTISSLPRRERLEARRLERFGLLRQREHEFVVSGGAWSRYVAEA